MKKSLITLIFLALTVMSFSAMAADNNYAVFIDAGSSGSRIHVFQYQPSTDLPVLNDVFSENVKPGLSSFADHPNDAGVSLKKLLDDASQFLQKQGVDVHAAPINVLATAGMRLLPEDKQAAIYANVRNYIQTNTVFPISHIETISGKMEGLYGWLDINYLSGNFAEQKSTVGSIDMGGASTQIAFETDDQSRPDDEISVNINHQQHNVFSKSFLGLGEDQARGTMQKDQRSSTCYPNQYVSKTSVFDFSTCSTLYATIIQNQHVSEQILSTAKKSFIAYSGIYYTFNFFGVDGFPTEDVLNMHIDSECYGNWDDFKKRHPTVDEKYLSSYCADGSYHSQLLYHAYHLIGSPYPSQSQVEVAEQINKHDIDWTLGAALYSLTQVH
ncbi:MAG: GDA1/CD39 family protein [uncultured bacterium]|nr:MAG: GDA1/CD39 family protein [uncultured bacterium]